MILFTNFIFSCYNNCHIMIGINMTTEKLSTETEKLE